MADTTIRRLARTRAIQLRRGVGEQLAEARAVAEVSQRELATAAAIDRSVLSRAERGEANLTLDCLVAVSAALGMEASSTPLPGHRASCP